MKVWVEIEVDVEYDYSPGCAETQTDPACDAELTVTAIELDTYDIAPRLSTDNLSHIRACCWDEVLKDNED